MFLWAYCLRTKEHSDLRFVVVNFDFMKAQKHFGDNQIYHQQWGIHLACESRRISGHCFSLCDGNTKLIEARPKKLRF